jgi:hypothetical protein
MYKVLEGNHLSKTNDDVFLKAVMVGRSSDEAWNEAQRVRSLQKVLEMKMGDFHEELLGKLPGWETYPQGHSTGCDVGKLDGREIAEVKNRDNTMNSSSAESVLAKLKKQADKGVTAILIQINCPDGKVNRFKADPRIKVWNGQEAYAHFSGRASFFDDLQKTLTYVFAKFKTLAELKLCLGTA